jgi:hypothetical protein
MSLTANAVHDDRLGTQEFSVIMEFNARYTSMEEGNKQ